MSDVTIYTKTGCPYCAAAKEHYRKNGVDFREIDIFAVDGAKDEASRLAGGERKVPVIVEDGKVKVGFGGA